MKIIGQITPEKVLKLWYKVGNLNGWNWYKIKDFYIKDKAIGGSSSTIETMTKKLSKKGLLNVYLTLLKINEKI